MTLLALSTSMPKSACPGVSIRLKIQLRQFTGMLADCMVIPRSRSAGRKSVVVLPVSTEPAEDKKDDFNRIDSVNVVFPESEAFYMSRSGEGYRILKLTDMSHKSHIPEVRRVIGGSGCIRSP